MMVRCSSDEPRERELSMDATTDPSFLSDRTTHYYCHLALNGLFFGLCLLNGACLGCGLRL
jgi:hypothetical protein